MVDVSRIHPLNQDPVRAGDYVLYWMQQSQRAAWNHALEYAAQRANELVLPLLVGFGLTDDYPEANLRHYAFMVEGLADISADLKKRGIAFVMRRGNPPDVALSLTRGAAMVVCDRGYLRHQKRWRDAVADGAGRAVIEVESDVVVPVEAASDHSEYAARTLRPKIHRLLDQYLHPVRPVRLKIAAKSLRVRGDFDPADVEGTLAKLKVDRTVSRSTRLHGGSTEARRRLNAFLRGALHGYADGRNEPAAEQTSMMSAYLHFGQISPLQIALAVRDAKAPAADRNSCLEELIVRRELAVNYAEFCPQYDSYEGLPTWAKGTLRLHERDPRDPVYDRTALEAAKTHDLYWNAAQTEMTATGYMHNYMRMYWGKKIIEWSNTPEEAFDTALHLNNKYFLDGRDVNAYANVAWLFGLHDRPWQKRPIFGNVRYMNAAGLERKFDMDAYVQKVERMTSVPLTK